MKQDIHPKFYKNAKILDTSSGETFIIGSTLEDITVEISSLTHPFYTGKQRIVDTDNLVEKFQNKMNKVNSSQIQQKKTKKVARKKSSVEKVDVIKNLTLKDMLKNFQ